MWLLNTRTLELTYFNDPRDRQLSRDGGYAILSHVWQQGGEQSFQDVRALHSRTRTLSSDTPRSRAAPKIRDCCILAERHGYRWVWIDTCCIDKTSSAELSEAINSMYAWYAQAAVCYAYLQDVDHSDLGPKSLFYGSRWFTRGWTLQELIAPTSLLFISNNWTIFGTRTDLVAHLEKITGVDADVLLRRRKLETVSVAQRMSWASRRATTRIEDEAYCLMGIFGVNMPTIYGEGQAAFYRLQEEIMKVSPDQTIFAWGDALSFTKIARVIRNEDPTYPVYNGWRDCCLFASSPTDFAHSHYGLHKPEPIPVTDALEDAKKCLPLYSEKEVALLSADSSVSESRASEFTVTSHGMRSTLPIIWIEEYGFCIAVLGCRDASRGAVVGLLLRIRPEPQLQYQGDHKIYTSGFKTRTRRFGLTYRLVLFNPKDIRGDSDDLSQMSDMDATEEMRYLKTDVSRDTIHIMRHPPPQPENSFRAELRSGERREDIRFSQWSLAELQTWGFRHRLQERVAFPELGSRNYQVVVFGSDVAPGEEFTIVLGECFCGGQLDFDSPNSDPNSDWATTSDSDSHGEIDWVEDSDSQSDLKWDPHERRSWDDRKSGRRSPGTRTALVSFDTCCGSLRQQVKAMMASGQCSPYHVQGQNWTRTFGNEDRAVRLTVSTLPQGWEMHSGGWRELSYFIIDIVISGNVYTSLHERTCNLDLVKTLLSGGSAPDPDQRPQDDATRLILYYDDDSDDSDDSSEDFRFRKTQGSVPPPPSPLPLHVEQPMAVNAQKLGIPKAPISLIPQLNNVSPTPRASSSSKLSAYCLRWLSRHVARMLLTSEEYCSLELYYAEFRKPSAAFPSILHTEEMYDYSWSCI